jgi:hypothetical protein
MTFVDDKLWSDEQTVAAPTRDEMKGEIIKGLVAHHCSHGLADWLSEMNLQLDEQRKQIAAIFDLLASCGLVVGGVPVSLHELHDRVVHLEQTALTLDGPTLDTERHLGGPDDNHYARLGKYQPLEIVASWSEHWQKRYIYPLGESIYMISRFSGKNHGDKEQSIRDMRKLAFFADWIADDLEELGKTKP